MKQEGKDEYEIKKQVIKNKLTAFVHLCIAWAFAMMFNLLNLKHNEEFMLYMLIRSGELTC